MGAMQRFEQETSGIERLTPEEAEEVLNLYSERQREAEKLSTMTSVVDVAEALQVPPENVQTLLAEVRARKADEAHLKALNDAVSAKQRLRVVSFVVALALAMVAALLMLVLVQGPEESKPAPVIIQRAPKAVEQETRPADAQTPTAAPAAVPSVPNVH
jgi:hypothetical protein